MLLTISQRLKKSSKKLKISIKKENNFTASFFDLDNNARHREFNTEPYDKKCTSFLYLSVLLESHQDCITPTRNFGAISILYFPFFY